MNMEQDIQKIKNVLERFKLPTIQISPKAQNADSIFSSKFGGIAYWPKNKAYPCSKCGKKLNLLAQLNFSEIPTISNFPTTGLLQFFIASDDTYGLDFDTPIEEVIKNPNGYKVVYHPKVEKNISELLTIEPEYNKEDYFPVPREFSLDFNKVDEIPSPTDFRYKKYAGDPLEYDDDLAEYIYDYFSSVGSKIGGYAHFTQDDPRQSGVHDDWVLLFQMDSVLFGNCEILWGDMGVSNFFIEKTALQNRDFSRTWYNWDCS